MKSCESRAIESTSSGGWLRGDEAIHASYPLDCFARNDGGPARNDAERCSLLIIFHSREVRNDGGCANGTWRIENVVFWRTVQTHKQSKRLRWPERRRRRGNLPMQIADSPSFLSEGF
ncbi:MAG: hypothetical protein LBT00_01265 [Spirochaetaceae bacterium]|nr:hypothetical protein [Spirochaetaceae bacterium]